MQHSLQNHMHDVHTKQWWKMPLSVMHVTKTHYNSYEKGLKICVRCERKKSRRRRFLLCKVVAKNVGGGGGESAPRLFRVNCYAKRGKIHYPYGDQRGKYETT